MYWATIKDRELNGEDMSMNSSVVPWGADQNPGGRGWTWWKLEMQAFCELSRWQNGVLIRVTWGVTLVSQSVKRVLYVETTPVVHSQRVSVVWDNLWTTRKFTQITT